MRPWLVSTPKPCNACWKPEGAKAPPVHCIRATPRFPGIIKTKLRGAELPRPSQGRWGLLPQCNLDGFGYSGEASPPPLPAPRRFHTAYGEGGDSLRYFIVNTTLFSSHRACPELAEGMEKEVSLIFMSWFFFFTREGKTMCGASPAAARNFRVKPENSDPPPRPVAKS